jgi:hypothetical protein
MSQLNAQMSKSAVSPTNNKFTRRSNLPAEPSVYFRGRDKELAAIKSALRESSPREIGRCAVWGMPGIGKSQLALAYAQQEFLWSNYDLIIWLSGTTPEKLVEGLTDALILLEHPARAEVDTKARSNALQRWLEQCGTAGCERWLIIVDNLDASAVQALRQSLPKGTQRGDVLITTRREDVAKSLLRDLVKPIEILALSAHDSVALLLERASLPNSGDSQLNEVLAIVRRLGCHPLALDQAGAMMEQRKGGLEMLRDMFGGASYSTVRVNFSPMPVSSFLTQAVAAELDQRAFFTRDFVNRRFVLWPFRRTRQNRTFCPHTILRALLP